jgi:hypothetical protein
MAASNKYLARRNRSRIRAEATKQRDAGGKVHERQQAPRLFALCRADLPLHETMHEAAKLDEWVPQRARIERRELKRRGTSVGSSTAELVRSPEALTAPRMQVRPSPGEQRHQGGRVLPAAMSFSARCRRGICVRHDTDPVINPSADRSEVLRLDCVVLAHLLDARLGRRQLLPQRGNFTPSGLAKIFGDDCGRCFASLASRMVDGGQPPG